ncbi:MAG: hypothetical protein RJB37_3003 [Pseudomonadota bacterium]
MPLELQARLLRVLEERQVTPLGAEETLSVNFQLLSASHRDLQELIAEGRFREDLYYRLAGVELRLPALRERTDRRELIRSLLVAEGGVEVALSAEAERLLMAHPWPGNVRQLRHVLRSACALADGDVVRLEHLPSLTRGAAAGCLPLLAVAEAAPELPAPILPASVAATAAAEEAATAEAVSRLNPILANERQVLIKLLEHHRWNVSNVAKALDVSRNTLYRKLHKLHIQISHAD